ncbi:hypothetical protein I3843_15G098300 [Carya illinoinensis]|nr:hypothetical protein I3843_15G098300 [Carya illinoinensis]
MEGIAIISSSSSWFYSSLLAFDIYIYIYIYAWPFICTSLWDGKAFGSGRCTCPAASSPSLPTSFVTLFSVFALDSCFPHAGGLDGRTERDSWHD